MLLSKWSAFVSSLWKRRRKDLFNAFLLLHSLARSLGFTILGEIFTYVIIVKPTIKVVTFRLHGHSMHLKNRDLCNDACLSAFVCVCVFFIRDNRHGWQGPEHCEYGDTVIPSVSTSKLFMPWSYFLDVQISCRVTINIVQLLEQRFFTVLVSVTCQLYERPILLQGDTWRVQIHVWLFVLVVM